MTEYMKQELAKYIDEHYCPADDFKVVYETLKGGNQVSEWMTDVEARKFFDKLKKDGVTIWADLIFSPIIDDLDIDETVIDRFTKKKVNLMGKVVLI